ncbi:hypothetical protein HY345_00105 [Candidatus Microgenomates bacterium]|nr:hypothetical protein [Candidatus Microgenomates bacterium]
MGEGQAHEQEVTFTPPVDIRDKLGSRYADLIGAHQVHTRDNQPRIVMTIGCTNVNTPTHAGEVSRQFETHISPSIDDLGQETIEGYTLLQLPNFGENSRTFASMLHETIVPFFQAANITPEVLSQMQELFDSVSSETSYGEIISQVGQLIFGELILQPKGVSKQDLVKFVT